MTARVRYVGHRVRADLNAHIDPQLYAGTTVPGWPDTEQAELTDEPAGPRKVCFDRERLHAAIRREYARANERTAQAQAEQRRRWESKGYAQGIAHAQHQYFWLGSLVGGAVCTAVTYGLLVLKAMP